MGQATRNIANSFTTSGVITSSAVNNSSLGNITDLALGGSLILLSEQTAASDASISFTSGIDSTYDEYLFLFTNLHPSDNGPNMTFQGSTNGGSSYGINITSTNITVRHFEDDSSTTFQYDTGADLAQSTSEQVFTCGPENQNDSGVSGYLKLYNPSSTTYVKHFTGSTAGIGANAHTQQQHFAGYFNTTSAVNAIRFKINAGTIQAGTFQLFGVK